MQRSINEEAQRKRRKEAFQSAAVSTLLLVLSAGVLQFLHSRADGFWGAVLLILSMLDLGMVIPVWILLKTRLKEIEGGEEDAAAQY
ncbi:MAG: hypothetical protein ACI4PH_08210 [Faecousia sp.]